MALAGCSIPRAKSGARRQLFAAARAAAADAQVK